FATMAEGVRGKRAVDWRLVDETANKSQFEAAVARRLQAMIDRPGVEKKAIEWEPLRVDRTDEGSDYEFVKLRVDRAKRVARLVVAGPRVAEAPTLGAVHGSSAALWALRAFRELDDALLDLRFNHPTVGLILLETEGDIERTRFVDRALSGMS